MELTQEQIDEFNENGFLVLKNFADTELCDEIYNTTQKHMDEMIAPYESEEEYLGEKKEGRETLRRLRQVYQREDIYKDWMTNKEIRPILKQLLNDRPVITLAHHNSIMTKMPHESSKTTWHQDRRYWNYENDNLISIWLSLGDEFLDNGLLEFIPKSHKMNFSKEQFDEKISFREDLEENKELIKTKVHTLLQKGDVVLFHCKTLHYASKNYTDKAKISFVYTVKAESTKAIKGTRSDFDEVVLEDIK